MAYPVGHVETFVLTAGTSAINVVTGTTAAPTTSEEFREHKGATISFQCQHVDALVKVGGANVSSGGIRLTTNFGAPYQVTPATGSSSAVNAAEWWVIADKACTVVVQVIHSI